MTNAALVDQHARDDVTGALGRTLFVEAGAGSGKTTSLVGRIVALVAAGVHVDQIAAITFTEAAATELRIRVRDALEAEGFRRDDVRLLQAAGQVESAAFTTLHGFALRLLSDHPVEAGLPPGFGVVDEISSILSFDEAWRIFAGRVGDDLDLLDLQGRAAVLRLELKRFPDVARRFDDNWDLLSGVDRAPAPLSPLDFSDAFGAIAGLAEVSAQCSADDDKLVLAIDTLLDTAAQLAPLGDPLDQLAGLMGLKWPGKLGRKASWVELPVEEARAAVAGARAVVDRTIETLRHEVIAHMVAMVADFVDARVAARRERGELAFHDLLVLSRQLLRSHETVRHRLHQTYQRILLDEFQDTDPIQIELAVLLASAEPVEDRPWPELAQRLPHGRLVVVGDPKQSIYRFRRADIAVYTDAEAHLVDTTTKLTTNFRSVAGIVDWVNDVFSDQIGDGDVGAQPSYTPLDAARGDRPDGSPAVLVMGGPADRSVSVGSLREREANDVAAVACRAIEEEWLVERDGSWQPARLSDIAVLIPSRLSLPALESAFAAANVPFRPETSSLVYATQEVRDILAGVRALADPTSSVDVVAALRSALFAIGDDGLLAWKLAGGSFDYRVIDPDGYENHPIALAFADLRRWHERRWWDEPAALIERIVRERRLREQALAWPRPRDRWRRHRFLIEQARQFSATQGGDLLDFVAWVDIQSSDAARVTEPIPSEPDDDAVRVLTVHGSKGLEFPIVVLAGAPTQEQSRRPGAKVLFPRDGGEPDVAISKDNVTKNFEIRASVEELLDTYERVRLHYVAATRARDRLVASAYHKENTASSGKRTWESLHRSVEVGDGDGASDDGSVRAALWEPFEARGDERYDAAPPTQLRLAGGTFDEEVNEWRTDQARVDGLASAGGSRSATGIAGAIGPSRELVPEEPDTEQRPWRRGRAGSAIGSAVHAALQHIDLATGAGAEELARLHATREGVPQHTDEIETLIRSALTAPTVRRAAERPSWRELYVAMPAGGHGGVVEGYIDLLVEEPDGLVVADFKTDLLTTEAEIDRALAGYELQAATYAVALEHITDQRVIDCRFLFVGTDGVTERSVVDLDAAMARVRAEIAS